MTITRSIRAKVSIGLVAAGLVLGALAGAIGAQAAPKGPHLVVTPAAGLVNKQIVRVSGTGFKPHDAVYIVECLRTATGQNGCDISGFVAKTINAKGQLPTIKFRVKTGAIATGKCGTTKANLNKCEVSVGNANGGDTASAPVVFKLPGT